MKKFLISAIILCLFTFALSFCVFATNNMSRSAQNTTSSIGNAIGNTANGAKNVIANGENMVENGISNVKNVIVGSTNNMTADVKNNTDSAVNTMGNTDNDYDATKTATNTGLFGGMTSTGWTWLILGIVGAALIGLIWYYGNQYEHSSSHND